MKKIILLSILSCLLFLSVGSALGFSPIGKEFGKKLYNDNVNKDSSTIIDQDGTLETDLYKVNLIIKGKVEKIEDSFKRNSGIQSKVGELIYDVTPAKINVEQVIYGEQPTSNEIKLLQHGVQSNPKDKHNFVNKGDEVILILVKTIDGYYWSYNFDDGIWFVNNGFVDSKTDKKMFQDLKKVKETEWINVIKNAAKNKKKRLDTIYD